MAWRSLKTAAYYRLLGLLAGVIILFFCVAWFFKIQRIQRAKNEISRLQTSLSQGQEIWRKYPPLTPAERKELEKARERLFRMLPKEKEIPSLLEDLSRLAREHHLVDVSFDTGHGVAPSGTSPRPPANVAPAVVAPQSTPAPSPKPEENSGPIQAVPIKVTFAGDYREIAFFLEALRKMPRLVTVQTLKIQRGVPLLPGEVVLHAYYQKGELLAPGK